MVVDKIPGQKVVYKVLGYFIEIVYLRFLSNKLVYCIEKKKLLEFRKLVCENDHILYDLPEMKIAIFVTNFLNQALK